ncbi:MAG TPA: glycerophosphodiester phosphodiesterase family protein [Pirellulaceae bacterium]|nr:glycerophosphodiester phosphodiesterase family protein [Pirellulaceae bacterium]
MAHYPIVILLLISVLTTAEVGLAQNRKETAVEAAARHRRVAERRDDVHIICHRGAVEFAHENTLEAYRAAFELGADGNEIDIRATKDGMLVCFHDDMLDHLLEAYGDVSDYAWDELQKFPFRNPGRFDKHCRIPTLREVFELHRAHAGLMFLDVKRPHLFDSIAKLLDELDLWDHVVQAPADFTDPRIKNTRGKASLYLDRTEIDVKAIAAALKKPGGRIIVEDPRGVAFALGRTIAPPSDKPVRNEVALWASNSVAPRAPDDKRIEELLQVLHDAGDWNVVATGTEAEAESAQRILQRVIAADELAQRSVRTTEVFAALEQRVRDRSLHRSWRHCGLDGIASLRALIALKAPRSVNVARFCLWRDDPAVETASNPKFNNPRSWTDWRTKVTVFSLLETVPGPETEQLCHDYLALSDEEARNIGVPQFEATARTLLIVSPTAESARVLLNHHLSSVRGRAVLFCLAHVEEAWARNVLQAEAPHSLEYVVARRVRIALVGDSTVASYPNPPDDRPDLTGWGQVLGEFFTPQVEVFNHARSGRSSKSFIREGHWLKTLTLKPDYVFIQFGHNDGPGKGDRSTDPHGDFRDYLRQYLMDARRNGIRPILVTPMTRRRFQDGKIHSSLGPWVDAMRAVGLQQRVPVVDLHAASVHLLNELGDEGSADLSPSSSDRTHFSRKGAMAMARLVVQSLHDVEPRLATLLRESTP